DYANSKDKIYRGVQVLDFETKERIKNTPFLHNARIDEKDQGTGGGLRKAARLMKSLKYDSEAVDLSSYDIVSIAFNMPNRLLAVPRGAEMLLLKNCIEWCQALLQDAAFRADIRVPDGHRQVFCDGHGTYKG